MNTPANNKPATPVDVIETIRDGYAAIAQSGIWSGVSSHAGSSPAGTSCCTPSSGCCAPSKPEAVAQAFKNVCGEGSGGGCCGPTTLTPDQVAMAVGYSQAELGTIPEGANMGLSCGNPTAIASLKPGEVVVDLGSGGGFDCFLAGPKVGEAGRVIGIDMTPQMLAKARTNIASYTQHSKFNNVEFRLGEIENIPVADASADVIISNCVLNLSTNKPRVWQEIARVLKPGGRVAVSDLALMRPLPQAIQSDVEALVGCIAGACLVDDMHAMMRDAGLQNISLVSKPEYVAAMTDWNDPLYQRLATHLPAGHTLADYITSLDITATR